MRALDAQHETDRLSVSVQLHAALLLDYSEKQTPPDFVCVPSCRVDQGRYRPWPPTDPDVRD